MRARYLIPLIAVIGLSGCGNWNTLYRQPSFSQSPADSVITDINARLLLAIPKTESDQETTSRILRNKPSTIVCAEPSPDALTTYAANATAGKNVAEKLSINGSAAYNSAGLYVGNRTQTIQLIRDQMYRLCEAYANGIIDSGTYEMMMTRSQRYTVALALIDSNTTTSSATEAATSTPEHPNKQAPKPESKKAPPQEREMSTQPNNEYTSIISRLLGEGDEGYLCLNFLRSLDNGTPTKGSGGMEIFYNYCSALFNEKKGSERTIQANTPNAASSAKEIKNQERTQPVF